jgi:hypothetical protein
MRLTNSGLSTTMKEVMSAVVVGKFLARKNIGLHKIGG